MVALAITSFQWFFIGYSLVFSETGGTFLGDGLNVGFRGVLERPVPESNGKLPEIVFAMYQMVSRRSPHTPGSGPPRPLEGATKTTQSQ